MPAPVVIIDLQTGMFDGVVSPPVHDAAGLVARVRAVMDWARRSGRKIAFVQQNSPPGDQLEPGTPGWQIWPALGRGPDDPSFGKSVTNAFSNADLVEWVGESGAGEVIVMGAATNHCVAASVAGGLAVGLKVTVVADAHSTSGETAPTIIAEHNAAFAAAGAIVVTAATLTAG